MNNIQKINDIKYLIIENYSDKEPLNEGQKASKQCFLKYCDDIRKELRQLERLLQEKIKLEKAVEAIKRKGFDALIFETNDYETYKKIWSKYYDNLIKQKQKYLNNFCDKCKLYTEEEYNLLKEVLKCS